MTNSIPLKKKSLKTIMLRSKFFNESSDAGDSSKYFYNEYDQRNFNDNWSKESCDKFLLPIESFLDYQLKRERSSKRRCKEIVKIRNLVNEKNSNEHQLKEYDMKINLNTLLKKGHNQSGQCPTAFIAPPHGNASGSSANYRSLIADELTRKHAQCGRCLHKNKRYEENYFNELMSMSFDASPMSKRRKNKNKIGLNFNSNNSKINFSSNISNNINNNNNNNNNNNSATLKLPKLNLNRTTFDFKNFHNTMNDIERNRSKIDDDNYRQSVLNKLPIEVQKNNIIN